MPDKKKAEVFGGKEKDSPKSEGEVVNAEEPESSSSPVIVGEIQETQEEVVVIESGELTIETLKQKIKDYETKIEELTLAVDNAAENELYDEAEQLQE